MTTPSGSAVPQGAPSEDEDDHDLLTYGIAGDRLREEIGLETRALALAEASGDQEAAHVAQVRIKDLEAAFARHTRARDGEFNEKQFFGEQFESGSTTP